jgi:hypothetical protein
LDLKRPFLLALCVAACSPSTAPAPPAPEVVVPAAAPPSTPPGEDTVSEPPMGSPDVAAEVTVEALADAVLSPADTEPSIGTAEVTAGVDQIDRETKPTDLTDLVAEMNRNPTPETAERLTTLGHIAFFPGPGDSIIATGFPAINADSTLFAVAGVPVKELSSSGDKFPVWLTLVAMDGSLRAELPLYDPLDRVDAATRDERLKAARAALGTSPWRTMKRLEAIEWMEDDEFLLPAYFADDGSALIELSPWSITADLRSGPWRATLPSGTRVEPGGPMRDDQGARCEIGRYIDAVHITPDLQQALLTSSFHPKNDFCQSRITAYVPMRLPGSTGGEGWTQAKRGGTPAWFKTVSDFVPEPTPDDDEQPDDERAALEQFIAVWGDRFPSHRAVRNAKRILDSDRKARTQP